MKSMIDVHRSKVDINRNLKYLMKGLLYIVDSIGYSPLIFNILLKISTVNPNLFKSTISNSELAQLCCLLEFYYSISPESNPLPPLYKQLLSQIPPKTLASSRIQLRTTLTSLCYSQITSLMLNLTEFLSINGLLSKKLIKPLIRLADLQSLEQLDQCDEHRQTIWEEIQEGKSRVQYMNDRYLQAIEIISATSIPSTFFPIRSPPSISLPPSSTPALPNPSAVVFPLLEKHISFVISECTSDLPLLQRDRALNSLRNRLIPLVPKYGCFALEPTGSSANGLWTKDSDVDVVVQFQDETKFSARKIKEVIDVLKDIRKAIKPICNGFIEGIFHAKVPILKFTMLIHGRKGKEIMHFDLSINNPHGIINTKLIRLYVEYDQR